MSERLFRPEFDTELKRVFGDLKEREKEQDRLFELERDRVKSLLTPFEPLPKDYVFEEDFNVAAVDGSGISPLLQYEDVLLYLVTANLIVLNTGTRNGRVMTPVTLHGYPPIPKDGYLVSLFWSSFDYEDLWRNFEDYVKRIYQTPSIEATLLPFFHDRFRNPGLSLTDIYERYGKRRLRDFIIPPPIRYPRRIWDQLRWIAEISLGKLALESQLRFKYLIYDTTLTLLISRGLDYPRLTSSYLIRGSCKLARERGTILMGLSKTHSMPNGERISALAREKCGYGSHWFMRIPGSEDPEGKLRFTHRRRIPPELGVTYLFRFTEAMQMFRVDFDRLWWEQNIQNEDPEEQKRREVKLFKEIEYISRDARWYGYPCPPAFAHVLSSVSHEERMILESKAIEIAKEIGFPEEALLDARGRLGLE